MNDQKFSLWVVAIICATLTTIAAIYETAQVLGTPTCLLHCGK